MRKRLWKNLIAGALLIVFLTFGTACGGSEEKTPELAQTEKETAATIISELSSQEEIGKGVEWKIMAIARSSLAKDAQAQSIFMKYYDSIRLEVRKTKGILDPGRPTDNARVAIALKMCGFDPADVEGYDLLNQLEDEKAVSGQGINAEIWALIATSVCDRKSESSEKYIEDICSMQGEDGGITYDGKTQDVDISAMAIQAISLYRDGNDRVSDVIDSARMWLASKQGESGNFGNAESTAQVILALSCLGEDPKNTEDFIKGDRSLYDGLMEYHLEGGFEHRDEGEIDPIATEQAACALDAMAMAPGGYSFFIL